MDREDRGVEDTGVAGEGGGGRDWYICDVCTGFMDHEWFCQMGSMALRGGSCFILCTYFGRRVVWVVAYRFRRWQNSTFSVGKYPSIRDVYFTGLPWRAYL